MKWKENETPMEMVTCLEDLAEKCLKEKTTRTQVVEEQFIEVLPEEAKVCVKARNYQGSLAEDFRQARKKELWEPTKSCKSRETTKYCNSCGRIGHLAKEYYYKQNGIRDRRKDLRLRRTGRVTNLPLIAKKKGHTSREYHKNALFC